MEAFRKREFNRPSGLNRVELGPCGPLGWPTRCAKAAPVTACAIMAGSAPPPRRLGAVRNRPGRLYAERWRRVYRRDQHEDRDGSPISTVRHSSDGDGQRHPPLLVRSKRDKRHSMRRCGSVSAQPGAVVTGHKHCTQGERKEQRGQPQAFWHSAQNWIRIPPKISRGAAGLRNLLSTPGPLV